MLIPEGIRFRGPPRSSWSGTPFAFAARSTRAFSTAAFAIRFPRTRPKRASSSRNVRPGSTSGRRNSATTCRAEVVVSGA